MYYRRSQIAIYMACIRDACRRSKMQMKSAQLMLSGLLVLLLGGCASAPKPLTQGELEERIVLSEQKVDVLLGEQKRDEAIGVLNLVTHLNPARSEPWSRLARLYFDAENYGKAIVAADEVLQRDPTDRMAKSVRAVSGLRVATESLSQLRFDTKLKGSARADAIGLAKVLRETLGEEVLVPPIDEAEVARLKEQEEAKTRRARARRAKRAEKRVEAPVVPTEPVAAPSMTGDPFSVLK